MNSVHLRIRKFSVHFRLSNNHYFINMFCSFAQFGNPLTFKHVNDTDICDVERLIRHKMLEKIERDISESMSGAGDADDLLIDDDKMKEYFGDVYYKDPNNFEFLPGDLKLIRLMVEHVQTNVDANGINKGLSRYTQKKNQIQMQTDIKAAKKRI